MNPLAILAALRTWGPALLRWIPWALAGAAVVFALVVLLQGKAAVATAQAAVSKAHATLAQEREAHALAVAGFQAAARRADAESDARFTAALQTQKESHERISRDLRRALAASDLRNVGLSRELARLHDAAARGGADGPPADPAASGDAPDPPEGAANPTVADLIETAVQENYAICHRNAAQLVELQAWYESLRRSPSTTQPE